MATGETAGPIHPVPTQRSRYRYQFTDKHHGRGGQRDAARWLPGLSAEDEFAVFDTADLNDISDPRRWLYGIRTRDAEGEIPDLGTWGQQMAEFPFARPNETWHGYPLWPLAEVAPRNRKGEAHRPHKEVFIKMEAAGMITARERKRLLKAKHL